MNNMNHYIASLDINDVDLWGVYSNTNNELLAAFKTVAEAKAFIVLLDGSYY